MELLCEIAGWAGAVAILLGAYIGVYGLAEGRQALPGCQSRWLLCLYHQRRLSWSMAVRGYERRLGSSFPL
jgi:hypothetical protein